MHLVPSGPAVMSAMARARKGDVVRLNGYLVDIRADDGASWRTSMNRRDTGGGACEIVWVTAFEQMF